MINDQTKMLNQNAVEPSLHRLITEMSKDLKSTNFPNHSRVALITSNWCLRNAVMHKYIFLHDTDIHIVKG